MEASPAALPMVGRDVALVRLADAHAASSWTDAIATIRGEAGIGKSRLAEALAATVTARGGSRARGSRVPGGGRDRLRADRRAPARGPRHRRSGAAPGRRAALGARGGRAARVAARRTWRAARTLRPRSRPRRAPGSSTRSPSSSRRSSQGPCPGSWSSRMSSGRTMRPGRRCGTSSGGLDRASAAPRVHVARERSSTRPGAAFADTVDSLPGTVASRSIVSRAGRRDAGVRRRRRSGGLGCRRPRRGVRRACRCTSSRPSPPGPAPGEAPRGVRALLHERLSSVGETAGQVLAAAAVIGSDLRPRHGARRQRPVGGRGDRRARGARAAGDRARGRPRRRAGLRLRPRAASRSGVRGDRARASTAAPPARRRGPAVGGPAGHGAPRPDRRSRARRGQGRRGRGCLSRRRPPGPSGVRQPRGARAPVGGARAGSPGRRRPRARRSGRCGRRSATTRARIAALEAAAAASDEAGPAVDRAPAGPGPRAAGRRPDGRVASRRGAGGTTDPAERAAILVERGAVALRAGDLELASSLADEAGAIATTLDDPARRGIGRAARGPRRPPRRATGQRRMPR